MALMGWNPKEIPWKMSPPKSTKILGCSHPFCTDSGMFWCETAKFPVFEGMGLVSPRKVEAGRSALQELGYFWDSFLGILILVLGSQPSPAAPQTRMEPVGFHPTENSFKVGSFLSPVCWENRKIPWEMQGKKLGRFLWCQS